jgi:hypothetical protein
MATIPQNVSESTRRKNPHLYGGLDIAKKGSEATTITGFKGQEIVTNLVLQKSTDEQKLNKTEKAFLAYLQMLNYFWIGTQNITLKLGFDTRFTCDFYAIGFNGELIGFEVKGHMEDDARVKLYTAARQFPWIKFKLVRKTKNGWDIQDVKP